MGLGLIAVGAGVHSGPYTFVAADALVQGRPMRSVQPKPRRAMGRVQCGAVCGGVHQGLRAGCSATQWEGMYTCMH